VSISSSGVDLLAVGELDIQVLPSPNAPINALAFSIKTENIIKVRLIHLYCIQGIVVRIQRFDVILVVVNNTSFNRLLLMLAR
jgi:hypothetical protein